MSARLVCSLLAIGSFGLGAVGCGGAGKGTRQASAPRATIASAGDATGGAPAFHFGMARGVRGLLGDEDDDERETKTMGSVPEGDWDTDTDNDAVDNAMKGYYDGDDAIVSAFGRAAGASERRALLTVLRRYYEAAVAGDGATACSLTAPELVKSLPADYGRGSGPAYLRGATTCPALLALLFKHEHAQLNTALLVTGVRVSGGRAQVLLGSRTAPASYAILRREGRAWRIAGMLSAPLP